MIEGFFHPEYPDTPVRVILAALRFPSISDEWVVVEFLLDTGASVSCIHADAIAQLFGVGAIERLQASALPDLREFSGVGGIARYLTVAAQAGMRDSNAEWHIFDLSLYFAPSSAPEVDSLPRCLDGTS